MDLDQIKKLALKSLEDSVILYVRPSDQQYVRELFYAAFLAKLDPSETQREKPKPPLGVAYLDKLDEFDGNAYRESRNSVVELAEKLLPGIVSAQHSTVGMVVGPPGLAAAMVREADMAAVATALRTAVEFLIQTGHLPADVPRPDQEPLL